VRSHTGASSTEFTFTGEQNDPNGLEYLRARYPPVLHFRPGYTNIYPRSQTRTVVEATGEVHEDVIYSLER